MDIPSETDWKKYGLQTDEELHNDNAVNGASPAHTSSSHHNELFSQDQSSASKPWWKTTFFISQPILFGAWDGVFTACMINIFGVIVFLRSGWIVGEAGIGNSMLIVVIAILIILASVFAGIGICERCPVERGGVYFLISHVLGAKVGGAVGIVYCFGQAVSAALHTIGFGEAIGKLLPHQDVWIERAIALSVLVILVGINIAGVIWVIKLQFVLLIILLLAALDFSVGSFIHTKPEAGVDGYFSTNFWNNSKSAYTENNNWFTVFGVFFPTLTGIFAGINMSGDLRNPPSDIPIGTLSAIGTSSFLYLTFILILGATCQRSALLTDYLIAEKVSALGVIFLAGLYISSVSSCLATLYGAPRVLQSIAQENVIPFINILGRGSGPNQIPKFGLLVITLLAVVFILVGQINTLAPLVTMPFLLTYAFINYAYFALAMTFDEWQRQDQKLRIKDTLPSPSFDKTAKSYGSTVDGADLDKLFPERSKYRQKTYTQMKLQTRASSATSSLVSSPDEHSSILSADEPINNLNIKSQECDGSSGSFSDFNLMLEKHPTYLTDIGRKSLNWYSMLCNRWISILGALLNIILMFFVHWVYALVHIAIFAVIYLYIGQVSPGVSPGVAKFKFFLSIKISMYQLFGKTALDEDQIIIPSMHPGVETMAAQLNEDNADYATRARYHQSEYIENR
uniref:Solute carrier family 12 member 8 n=1 Tax=Strigamia maritima TaxID=126957 RepID=T1JD20_STRMM